MFLEIESASDFVCIASRACILGSPDLAVRLGMDGLDVIRAHKNLNFFVARIKIRIVNCQDKTETQLERLIPSNTILVVLQ